MDDDILKPKVDPKIVIGGAIALVTLAGGGYLLWRKTRGPKRILVAVPAEEEKDDSEEDDWTLADLGVVPDISEVSDDEVDEEIAPVIEAGKSFIEQTLQPDDEPAEPERRVLFDGVDDDWSYEVEGATRSEDSPYILHRDEFHTDERDYKQQTLTYYTGDDILVDEEDTPIYNFKNILGELNFGHGSGDPNVVYIRNASLKAEYEVIKDSGLYSVEVLGLEIEENARVTDIQHSSDRKFRQD